MDANSLYDIKRLEEQIFHYKPNLKSAEKKKYVSDRLQNQLLHSKAVVKIQRIDAECESLMISLKQRLMQLQNLLGAKERSVPNNKLDLKDNGELTLNLFSGTSDDETLSSFISRQKNEESNNSNYIKDEKTTETHPVDSCEIHIPFKHLALRRQPRERRLSYKSYSSSSTSNPRKNRKKVDKQENTVTTSGVSSSSQENLAEEEGATPTIHIRIPSLHRGSVHYIVLDSLEFARKVFDNRINEVRQKLAKKSVLHTSKSRKKTIKKKEDELELSQLIREVMAEAYNDETLQATSDLENSNNNLISNFDFVENNLFPNSSQSSQEFSISESSNFIVEPICSTNKGENTLKKPRKNAKRPNEFKQKEPPKKRVRKSKQKNHSENTVPQPPTKSNLAQYVELFSNDCDMLPGSATPAASSTKSQHLVSSTTNNYELVIQQQQQQQTSSEPITYYIDGDWANGGPCQLVTSNSLAVEGRQCNINENSPFQDFVNYFDNGGNLADNVITTVLESNHILPVSIPRSIANFTFQTRNPRQVTHLNHQPSTIQNSVLPIINIQIPQLPIDITSAGPPPAHTHKNVVDLSVKSKASAAVAIESFNNLNHSCVEVDNEFSMPLDLSVCGKFAKDNYLATIDTQDEEFIRRLIEQSDFEFRNEGMKKGSDNEIPAYNQYNIKPFKAALDMPLLEFDASELAKLVENTSNRISQGENIVTDDLVYNGSPNNEDSNYVSMEAINTSVENGLDFTSQSTTELFNKLLDIRTDNHFLNEVNSEFLPTDELDESVFGQCRMENSTMCDELKNEVQKGAGKLSSDRDAQKIETTSSNLPSSSTSLATPLDCLNSAADVSFNFKPHLSDNQSSKLQLNLNRSTDGKISQSAQCLKDQRKQGDDELEDAKPASINSKSTAINANSFTKEEECKGNRVSKYVNETSSSYSPQENNVLTSSNDQKVDLEDIQQTKSNDDTAKDVLNICHEKYEENVVFSVSKISLSEDDNIYNTDSNFSSGRSCDLNECLSIEKEKESLKDSAASVCNKDFNLYSNQEENLQSFQLNAAQELATTSTNFECSKVKEPKMEIGKILITDLTPLELDSKLEDSLDFDEDYDDTLSLATSCFASPNDERFDNSIPNIDTKGDQPEASKELLETNIGSNPPQIKELKYFKIPKLNNATDSSSAKILNKLEPEKVNICNTSLTKLRPQPVLQQTVGKIERTVKNDLLWHIKLDADKMLAGKDFTNQATIEENVMSKVFGITCWPYLVDKCFDMAHCQLSHHLNDAEMVCQVLNTLDTTQVNVAYKILYNHSKLFEAYFKQFCIYYVNKNGRIKLLNMVNDCERYPEYAELIIELYESLVKCGLSRFNACRLILKRIRETSITTSIVEVLISMIMKSDWVMFTDFIEKYTQDMYQFNFRISILEQMAPAVLNSKSSDLKQVFGKCVQTLHRDDTALLLNSPTLIQCVALLTTNI